MVELSYISGRHFAFFLYNTKLAKYPTFYHDILLFFPSREIKKIKHTGNIQNIFPGFCVVLLLYFLSFFFFINIHLSTRKYNIKGRLRFSHALHLNKLIKAIYRHLLSWIKLRTGTDICKLYLLLQQERLKDFFVVILVIRTKKVQVIITMPFPILPLFHLF